MSKFSKALEKIQKGREPQDSPEKRPASFSVPEQIEDATRWDRGIQVARNAKPDVRVVTYHYPTSVLTEQYRMLGHNLKTQIDKEGAKVIMVSSAIHGEGKTLTATNLALTLIEMGNTKVALVDADLRRGRVGEYLGLKKDVPGLSSYLSNGLSPKQTMVRNSIENLTVIPCGERLNNPSGFLGSTKFRALIQELRIHFDYVLIDSPPIMAVADAGIIGKDVDGLLMVIQTGRTPKSVIAHASILFKQAGVKLLGYVLTSVEFQSVDYRYYYYNYNEYTTEEGTNQSWVSRIWGFKDRVIGRLKQIGAALERGEQGFNQWWERVVLKKKAEDPRPKTEDETDEVD
ncbi:MAG: CpsD/CapB family tyrosine-protein kinase [Candidatus Omnitrophica bacterium]|nr:CpsD/CapB family tyrosine-protein kinase [Candidatus Omnitrophota bacterium]